MEVRFGYVAMSVLLENASPSKSVTFKTYSQLAKTDSEAALNKVRRTARENLANTRRLLLHNKASEVMVYRFSSKLIPLATHPQLTGWDYAAELAEELRAIGRLVKENQMRVSFHPDHYTLLNSPREEVLLSSIKDLEHHDTLLTVMELDKQAKLITHIGGGYREKEKSIMRFEENWTQVPRTIAARLSLENDDKTFTAGQVLSVCRKLSLSMVLDLHHYYCNQGNDVLETLLQDIFSTWTGSALPPKIHISSPKSPQEFRSHHDYVNPDDLYPFLLLARELDRDIDVMVEAKMKDRAMFQLVKDLAAYPMIRRTGPASMTIH